jgi:hypothetical protein
MRVRMTLPPRTFRAGQSVEDYCRACHEDRSHTIIVVDGSGQPLRVQCGFCRSEHNYRGGPRMGSRATTMPAASRSTPPVASNPASPHGTSNAADRAMSSAPPASAPSSASARSRAGAPAEPLPLVTARERQGPPVAHDMTSPDLELLLRRIIREETGLTPVAPAEKWRGGDLILRPGRPGLQEKTWPIDTFFHKIVMLRNRLRTLEQQLNASDLPDDAKAKLQAYITGCYGSLTSFNVLFAEEDDKFVGSSGEG